MSAGVLRSAYACRVPDSPRAIQMLHDRIMVKPGTAGERTTRAGILIPATAEVAKRLVWGDVAGVGQHVRSVKTGDRVLFHTEDAYEVEVAGETYLVLRERDLHAVATDTVTGGTGLYL
jgi:chaperonin GroES